MCGTFVDTFPGHLAAIIFISYKVDLLIGRTYKISTMPLINIPIHVITENIKDKKSHNDLKEVKDNNKRLQREKRAYPRM